MSRRGFHRLEGVGLGLLSILTALAAPAGALAQEASPDLEQVGRRVLEASVRLEAAREAADRADSLRKDSLVSANQIGLDTLQLGPLRIAHLPQQRKLAEEVFGEVWSDFAPLLAGSEEGSPWTCRTSPCSWCCPPT